MTITGIDDRSLAVTIYSPVCLLCKHLLDYNVETRRCEAYTEAGSIPIEIWDGDDPHTEAHASDNGIQFEKGSPQAFAKLGK